MQNLTISRKLLPDAPLQFLKGVGEARASLLTSAGLSTVRDLFYFFPFRHEDRRHPVRIADLRSIDAPVTLRGKVVSVGKKTSPVKRLQIFEAILDDGSGTVMLVWFNQPYLAEQIKRNDRIAIYGQPRISPYGRLQIESPAFEKIEADGEASGEGSIVPVYSSIADIPPKTLRKVVAQALTALPDEIDPFPPELRARLGVVPLAEAIWHLHYPSEMDDLFSARRAPCHKRIIVGEFFAFQLALRLRRASEEGGAKRHTIRIDDAIRDQVRNVLPFALTSAQKRVLREIAADMQSERPMYRLLQGDVGSGKTIVALIAALVAIANGHQAALLAPTEILAEQHEQRIRQLVDQSGLRIAKLTGSTAAKERKALLRQLAEGQIDLVIGTHALLEESVRFKSLKLAIIDEQHRFGVVQRRKLVLKGQLPDVLVMTATPIPRSLAIAIYGDLELSVIDELPPGRKAIKTAVRGSSQLPKIHQFIEQQLAEGAQAYIVFPIIEESEKLDLKPLVGGIEDVRDAFPGRRIGMMHGRLPSDEKHRTMTAFKNGEIDILVSTTVIEVGIDVPNVSVMLVIDADRFGLSQLHQLRGRIGRGTRKSYCILVRDEKSQEDAKKRLRLFESTRDGFQVAERDLQLRGAGDFIGTRQSGIPKFRMGDILRDHDWMDLARSAATELVERDRAGASALMSALLPDAGEIQRD